MSQKRTYKKPVFKGRPEILACLFVALSTIAVYAQVWDHSFTSFDDDVYVTQNPYVQHGLTLTGIAWAFTATHAYNWHPLTWLSHMMDSHVYGMNAGWHHLTNVFFHIANAILLFMVLRRMTGYVWRSAFVASLFALHPLHVESVAWVAERKDVLSTFFWMLTLWGYLRYVEGPNPGRYLVVLLFFVLGLLAKPMLVTLPFVLLLLDYWPLERDPIVQPGAGQASGKRSFPLDLLYEKIPLFVLAAASSVVTFVVQQKEGAVAPLDLFPFDLRVANAVVAYLRYLGKMIWPQHLAFLYPYPLTIPLWQLAGACLLFLSISYLVIRMRRRAPYLAVGWLWYVGTLVPVIGLVQVGSQAMADRYTYVPLIGIFVSIAWAVPELLYGWRHRNMGMAIAAGVLLFILAANSHLQVTYWANSTRLYTHGIDVTDNNHKAHNNLGNALADQGRLEAAERHYSEALRIRPRFPEAHFNLGNALANQGNDEAAIGHYSEALRLRPDYAKAFNNLGTALARQGKLKEAVRYFSEAVRINPDFHEARNNLANALAGQGNLKEASHQYSEALRLKPTYAEAYLNLADALEREGDLTGAEAQYMEALRLRPDYVDAHFRLGINLARQGKLNAAKRHYSEVLRRNPDHAGAHYNLGVMHLKTGNLKEAIRHFSEAVRLKPDFLQGHINLADALARKGRLKEATGHYAKALGLDPENADAHNNLGIALARQGHIQAAAEHFSEALRINPDFPEAQQNLDRALQLMQNPAGIAGSP